MNNKMLAKYALIASVYTVINIVIAPFSFGMMQVRIGEALMVLCLLDINYVYALTLGCFLTNLIGVFMGLTLFVDVIFGTLATFIAGILVYYLRHIKIFNLPLLSLSFIAIINGLIVGIELHLFFSLPLLESIFYVAVGEIIATIIGMIIYKPLAKLFISNVV